MWIYLWDNIILLKSFLKVHFEFEKKKTVEVHTGMEIYKIIKLDRSFYMSISLLYIKL